MISGVLVLKTRRNVSLAAGDVAGAAKAVRCATGAAPIGRESERHRRAARTTKTDFTPNAFIALLDAGNGCRRFIAASAAGAAASRTRFYQHFSVRQAKSHARLFGLEMAQRDRQGVGGVGGLRRFRHREQRAYHQLHLLLVGVTIAGHARFYFARRITVDRD